MLSPALLIDCGKDGGKGQETKRASGYDYKLAQGTTFAAWPKTARQPHCWTDDKELRFELTVPTAMSGIFRLDFLDGDAKQRRQKLIVQGKPRDEIKEFTGAGKRVEFLLSADDLKSGKIDVAVQALTAGAGAVVSRIEFVPTR